MQTNSGRNHKTSYIGKIEKDNKMYLIQGSAVWYRSGNKNVAGQTDRQMDR